MDIVEQRKKAFFGQKFDYFLSVWMKSNHKTQRDFCIEADVSKNIVTAWKKGERFPRDAQMQKICETLGVEEGAFLPFFDVEKEDVYNSHAEERSRQLQEYAEENGLNDEWYQYFSSRKGFLKKFPFHDMTVKPLYNDADSEERFNLVKFQFEDDSGHRIMLSEEDIDFLVSIQEKNEAQIMFMLYREREKIDRQRVADCVDSLLETIHVDRDEVMKRLYAVDFTDQTGKITKQMIGDIVCQIAEENGIKPQITEEELKKAESEVSSIRAERLKQMRKFHRMRGKTEEEIDQILRESEKMRRGNIEKAIEEMRVRGYLTKDDNTETEE